MDSPGKWLALILVSLFISVAWATSEDSKYKAEAIASATESWSKVIVACLNAGQNNCNENYKMVIK